MTSEHTADTSDLQRFRQFGPWKDKTGNDLALAIWQYLCDYETGLYHFNEILDGGDPFDEYATVRDPLKILNVYNMGYCGIFGPVLDGILQGVGFEQGRSFGLERWNHCATEVWYDNAWHYLDMDVRGVLLDDRGIAVSLEEAQRNRGLWVTPPRRIEPFFPNDPDKGRVFEIYNGSPVHNYYRWFQGGHTMDFSLRQGESFTRWWTPQGGRWHHLPRYSQTQWVRDLILTPPVGMKPNHREFTRWNHGNGLFHYAPDLSAKSTDFHDGVYAVRNLTPGEQGLHLVSKGDAEVVFEVFTPYVIVARINDVDNPGEDTEASVVALETGSPVTVAVSLDHGLTWKQVDAVEAGGKRAADLTSFVKGTYGYLLRLSTSGAENQVAIKALSIDTWVQVAPISLPRLKRGENHLRYEVGDRYDLRTVPMQVNPDTSNLKDLEKYVVAMPDDYDPQRHTSRILGDMTVRLAAPAGMKIAWLSVGATFRTHQGGQAAKTNNRISYAVGETRDFREVYRSSVPTWVNHWRYNWDTDIRLDQPTEVVYVKYHGDPGLNTVRACLHLLPTKPPAASVQITHAYDIGGKLYNRTVELAGPAAYTISCDGDPENVSVMIAVPSH
ncbi:MAG: hypothetical protein A2Y77_13360 [Planctomycetes bacterium RBG_13_62_9]|nr:MAG: hypothetical protein A2Y77_13360 [Planctomycetes bacterium RBG_13_62_9]